MTAEWEAAMRAIAGGSETMDRFLATTTTQLAALVAEAKARRALPPPPPAKLVASRPQAKSTSRHALFRHSSRSGRH
jgi:hypothetical protein